MANRDFLEFGRFSHRTRDVTVARMQAARIEGEALATLVALNYSKLPAAVPSVPNTDPLARVLTWAKQQLES